MKNWAGNYEYQAANFHHPRSVDEICQLVRRSIKAKVLGSRHSFNDIADSPGDLISLQHFDRVLAIDDYRAPPTVVVEGGITYGRLSGYLHARGYALHNLASLPHISVAGACATATHGSGTQNGNLATAVCGMEIVRPDGMVEVLSRKETGESFDGMVVSLGGLGVITKLSLDLVPAFEVRQDVYENLPLSSVEHHFDEIFSAAYSISLFTDWSGAFFNQAWLKRRITEVPEDPLPPKFFGATLATQPLHPILGVPATHCTAQMGIPGPWQERLPHFRMDFTPSNGDELQSEYLVPRENALNGLAALAGLREDLAPLLQVAEVRTVAADKLWMSPCYETPCVAFHFTWRNEWPALKTLLPKLESALAPFNARPHWGKLFTMQPEELHSRYPRLADFRKLAHSRDPEGKFNNRFLDRYIYQLPT
jgi:xylitol oxidase